MCLVTKISVGNKLRINRFAKLASSVSIFFTTVVCLLLLILNICRRRLLLKFEFNAIQDCRGVLFCRYVVSVSSGKPITRITISTGQRRNKCLSSRVTETVAHNYHVCPISTLEEWWSIRANMQRSAQEDHAMILCSYSIWEGEWQLTRHRWGQREGASSWEGRSGRRSGGDWWKEVCLSNRKVPTIRNQPLLYNQSLYCQQLLLDKLYYYIITAVVVFLWNTPKQVRKVFSVRRDIVNYHIESNRRDSDKGFMIFWYKVVKVSLDEATFFHFFGHPRYEELLIVCFWL